MYVSHDNPQPCIIGAVGGKVIWIFLTFNQLPLQPATSHKDGQAAIWTSYTPCVQKHGT